MNAVAPKYTQAEIEAGAKVMAQMMPYLLQGMSFKEAGEALIMRQYELVAFVQSGSEEAKTFIEEMSAQVYTEIRKGK